MENASKAIIMAGGILIALVIISLLVIVFNSISDVYSQEGESLEIEQLEEYNRRFATYNNTSGLYGSELLSLANLIVDYDNRLLYGEDTSSDFYTENKIVVKVILYRDFIGYEDDNIKFNGLKAKKWYDIETIKQYNDELEKQIATMVTKGWNNQKGTSNYDTYNNMKSLLTELRSMPFKCISDTETKIKYEQKGYSNLKETQYNSYGRISEMFFVQEYL